MTARRAYRVIDVWCGAVMPREAGRYHYKENNMKYKVYIEERRDFKIEVEAENKEKAEEKAMGMIETKYEVGCEIQIEVEEVE